VKAYFGESGIAQTDQEFFAQALSVADDHRIQPALVNKLHDLDDVRMKERFATGQLDVIDVPPLLQEENLGLDVFERLVAGEGGSIAPFAGDIALVSDFDPADRIVVQTPRKSVEILLSQAVSVTSIVIHHGPLPDPSFGQKNTINAAPCHMKTADQLLELDQSETSM
jgi:hypothetical protein